MFFCFNVASCFVKKACWLGLLQTSGEESDLWHCPVVALFVEFGSSCFNHVLIES